MTATKSTGPTVIATPSGSINCYDVTYIGSRACDSKVSQRYLEKLALGGEVVKIEKSIYAGAFVSFINPDGSVRWHAI